MIVGYHIIFGAYGFWLPNDPRGSWSDFVGSWDLLRYGSATKTTHRHSLAYDEHDRIKRLDAKTALKYPPVIFTGVQARAVGRGFAEYVRKSSLPMWACAILPDHVHLVVAEPGMKIEQLVIQLKGEAVQRLMDERLHPMASYQMKESKLPKCWARGQWKVYLDLPDIERAIQYVENNPLKEGKSKQSWSFVTPYRG